jgi:hypothetical protein
VDRNLVIEGDAQLPFGLLIDEPVVAHERRHLDRRFLEVPAQRAVRLLDGEQGLSGQAVVHGGADILAREEPLDLILRQAEPPLEDDPVATLLQLDKTEARAVERLPPSGVVPRPERIVIRAGIVVLLDADLEVVVERAAGAVVEVPIARVEVDRGDVRVTLAGYEAEDRQALRDRSAKLAGERRLYLVLALATTQVEGAASIGILEGARSRCCSSVPSQVGAVISRRRWISGVSKNGLTFVRRETERSKSGRL